MKKIFHIFLTGFGAQKNHATKKALAWDCLWQMLLLKCTTGRLKLKANQLKALHLRLFYHGNTFTISMGLNNRMKNQTMKKPVRDLRGALPLINIIRYAINQDPALCKNPAT